MCSLNYFSITCLQCSEYIDLSDFSGNIELQFNR